MRNIIKKLRNIKGLSQQEVSNYIGINIRTYCIKENNPDKFTVLEIKKIAEIFEVKEEIFFAQDVAFTATMLNNKVVV